MDSVPFHLRPQEIAERAEFNAIQNEGEVEIDIEVLHLNDVEQHADVHEALQLSSKENLNHYTSVAADDPKRKTLAKSLKDCNQHLRHMTNLPWDTYISQITDSTKSYFEKLL